MTQPCRHPAYIIYTWMTCTRWTHRCIPINRSFSTIMPDRRPVAPHVVTPKSRLRLVTGTNAVVLGRSLIIDSQRSRQSLLAFGNRFGPTRRHVGGSCERAAPAAAGFVIVSPRRGRRQHEAGSGSPREALPLFGHGNPSAVLAAHYLGLHIHSWRRQRQLLFLLGRRGRQVRGTSAEAAQLHIRAPFPAATSRRDCADQTPCSCLLPAAGGQPRRRRLACGWLLLCWGSLSVRCTPTSLHIDKTWLMCFLTLVYRYRILIYASTSNATLHKYI